MKKIISKTIEIIAIATIACVDTLWGGASQNNHNIGGFMPRPTPTK